MITTSLLGVKAKSKALRLKVKVNICQYFRRSTPVLCREYCSTSARVLQYSYRNTPALIRKIY